MRRSFQLIIIATALFVAELAMLGSAPTQGSNTAGVTFSKEVAPIFFQKCAYCHRPGEIAPMSLLTYKDARPWAKSIREKVVDGSMPPWHADMRYGSFKNDRRLS